MDKAKISIMLGELLKQMRANKSEEYRSGYADGVLDMFNAVTKEIENEMKLSGALPGEI
jgi:hypothetical protein